MMFCVNHTLHRVVVPGTFICCSSRKSVARMVSALGAGSFSCVGHHSVTSNFLGSSFLFQRRLRMEISLLALCHFATTCRRRGRPSPCYDAHCSARYPPSPVQVNSRTFLESVNFRCKARSVDVATLTPYQILVCLRNPGTAGTVSKPFKLYTITASFKMDSISVLSGSLPFRSLYSYPPSHR
jgi:hypothetical protein